MVYELYLESVKIKVTRFEQASRLINARELACAVGMAFCQAGLPMPELEPGTDAEEFQKESLAVLEKTSGPGEKLMDAIRGYSRRDEKADEDMIAVLKLAYEDG
ncbi:MAG TPA: DUF3837 domain-containing protein [Candidatus Lachnoclostridium pullistercoris]|uniref:DUF3837 domain-containing protein n=1 Tax=Candidatus Lachnoclostridium pullistercoris TaxID=2838632 RepID=A0A9D2T556_9FIRM|nr:DUF3837 domain-containing protein [Candidatus Lachnoclostridium pullistercoris]